MAAITAVSPDSASTFVGKMAGPCVFVLFGAAGDLTKRKLVPALFNLVRAKLLPDIFAVMGVSVDELDNESFCKQVSEFLPTQDATSLDWLRTRLFYERGDFADAGMFARLRDSRWARKWRCQNGRPTFVLNSFQFDVVHTLSSELRWISGKFCFIPSSHSRASHMAKDKTPAECARMCVKNGMKYALVVGDNVYTLSGHEAELDKHRR